MRDPGDGGGESRTRVITDLIVHALDRRQRFIDSERELRALKVLVRFDPKTGKPQGVVVTTDMEDRLD